ncbi:MAG TPA: glycosyltransferase family 4 protein [Bryobacteraceae bacterium]|jgi:glycosyltransferase involved in cell wall biosynthesis|nr:glycosyltransferase family 4 protein [Bryobacteraceae bacterium]
MPAPEVLLIEGSDYETFPAGGQLTMARCLIKLFGDRLALVGETAGDEPAGRWTKKEIAGAPRWFFPVHRRRPMARRPLIPARLRFYASVKRYRKEIESLGCRSVFLQAPEALMAVAGWNWDSLCFWFPGVENPLKVSRYWWARQFCQAFDYLMFSALDRASVVLAAADENAILKLVARSKGRLNRERLVGLPTCVDTTVFRPQPMLAARAALGIDPARTVFVNSGRIGRFKGWQLLLDALEEYLRKDPRALLLFVGDGEDRAAVEASIAARNLQESARVTGFQSPPQVAAFLNAANVAVFGSFVEGWSASMLEALACGKPMVSTDVSGVKSMVAAGENGFIVNGRNAADFAQAMDKALNLANAEKVSTSIAAEFDLPHLGASLGRLWPPLAAPEPAR